MHFRATNFTVGILLLLAFTIAMMIVRYKKPVDNNWPLFYWLGILASALNWADDVWNFSALMLGAVAGLMLRFEFMSRAFIRFFHLIELVIQVYIVYFGFLRIAT